MKQHIFNLIDEKNQAQSYWNRVVNVLIILLILFSVFAIIVESFDQVEAQYHSTLLYFELFTVAIFTLEYLMRIWTADLRYPTLNPLSARLKFILSPMGIIDLLAILPFYLPLLIKIDMRFIRLLRVLRLLRILKLQRHSKALSIVGQVIYEKRSELLVTVFVTLILLLLSATVMYDLENEANPDKFPDIITTLWWSVATLTTVGYGDVYPETGWGKFVGGIIALIGVGLVALPTGIISASFIEALERDKQSRKEEEQEEETVSFNYCPHCGKPLNQHEDN